MNSKDTNENQEDKNKLKTNQSCTTKIQIKINKIEIN